LLVCLFGQQRRRRHRAANSFHQKNISAVHSVISAAAAGHQASQPKVFGTNLRPGVDLLSTRLCVRGPTRGC
jgi:hypothetical protein